ncbi:polysaccharide pyruvyl transferase family protein, partial [Umezakia ovalisporum]|uniref:polysaccharide pyruvyl transferase family protein n=1 Tax=Umezakia ovalisporum TaxID=75695 RepID=UPI0039C61584
DAIDLVVFAGTPEWLGPRCQPIIDFLDVYTDVPAMFVGVGTAEALYCLGEKEKRVLSRDRSLIITRSNVLASEVNEQIGIEKAVPLPCPAVFAPELTYMPSTSKKIAVIIQTDKSVQPINKIHFEQLRYVLNNINDDFDLIAFHQSEYLILKSNFPHLNIRYTDSSFEVIRLLNQYQYVLSTRLHGAIAAAGLGLASFIFKRDDYRIETTAGLFKSIISVRKPEKSIEWLANVKESNPWERHKRIRTFKELNRRKYESIFDKFFEGLLRFC